MPLDPNILPEKIALLKEKFEKGQFGDALLAALHTGQDAMRNRIFDSNVDIDGNNFGTYKKGAVKGTKSVGKKKMDFVFTYYLSPYQKKRAKAGRQTNPKNLYFTGALSGSIQTQLIDNKSAVIEFDNDLSAKIAKGQEAQITNIRNGGKGSTKGIGVKIFKLNQTEKEEVVEQGLELIKQEMQR